MATSLFGGVLRHLRRASLAKDRAGLTDGELLECFLATRDEAAFEALARRHGPMVLGVCRRVLQNESDAEDAFQATFLILVHKAATIQPRSMVGNWLYGVAHNTARKAKAMNSKRRVKEKLAGERLRTQSTSVAAGQLQDLLDDELSRLPDKFRVPVVLCDLEGKPLKEAARQLGWPQGTVASRLARARGMLAKRLACHGLVFSGGALGALLSEGVASAGVPSALLETTVDAASQVAAGGTTTAVVSAKVVALIERVTRTMTLRKLNGLAGLALLVAVGMVMGLLFCQARAQDGRQGSDRKNSEKQAQKAQRDDPAKAGRLYFHLDLGLTTAQPDGTAPEKVADFSQDAIDGFQSHSARLSQDGKKLAFGLAVRREINGVMALTPPERIFIRELTGTAKDQLLVDERERGRSLNNWFWSADGSQLAYSTWDKDSYSRSWVVDVKTKKVREIKMPPFEFKGTDYPMAIEAWSPDGKYFAASGNGLHLVKSDGTGPKRLTPRDTNVMGGSSRFSPDGRQVLFVKVNKGQSTSLYVADIASGKARPVVDALNLTEILACWSPDGRRIAFTATMLDDKGNRMGETSLYVTDADRKNLVTVRTERHGPNTVKMRLMDWR
jgi:RNA polymerase sigma factor (sigma-70 family)